MSAPQVVKIGDYVYVGGGMTRGSDVNVYKFSITQDIWTPLPPCPTFHHGLTTLNSELIAIGGQVNNKVSNTALTFRNGEWIKILPSMPTSRYFLSAVSHENRLIIAAGGTILAKSNGETVSTDAVEIYIKDRRMWYKTNPLPFPTCVFSMCVVNSTCYLLGSTPMHQDLSYGTLYATISSLLENARLSRHTWSMLQEEHPLCLSTSAELDGKLVTMGGSSHPMQRYGTKFISIYDFTSATWVECKGAQLPVPLYRAGVVKLDSDQVMIVGGQPKMQQFSAAVYIGKCYKARKKLVTC